MNNKSVPLPQMLRALRHRNYRLFFSGQSISLIGTWMTRLATAWLVWRLTHSAELLGLLGFAGQVPTFLFASFAGVWVDRLNRHHLLVATQVLAMLQSFALASLMFTGLIQVWQIFALQVFQGVINAFDMPTRQSLLIDLIEDRADLPNAVALNSSMVNATRLIGPSAAGLLIAWAGEGWCFFADGVSYIAVIVSLLAMRVALHPPERKPQRVLHDLSDGLRYAFGFTPIRAILLLLALLGLVGIPYRVLLPIIASETLHGGAHTLGFLMAAMGVGALIGALYLASRRSVIGLGRLIPVAAATFGAGLIGVGLSRWLPLSLLIMVATGTGFMVHLAASNTLIQTLVREDMRGRIMALYTLAFMGVATFGSLLAGVIAARIGAPLTLAGGGALSILGAAVFAQRLPRLREKVRPVYIAKGILPEAAETLREATTLREEVEQ
ncbi:MAG: MFS transporter [Gammaproteobacteria bacterium]